MGDPRKHRKKYKGPAHPWEKSRIEDEKKLIQDHGLKNKKEIWRTFSKLKRFTAQTKRLIRDKGLPQAVKEEKQLLDKLYKLNLLEHDAKLEDILSLDIKNLLERRLQTMIYNLKLALSLKQARQFITHGHIFVNGKKIDVPSYHVLRGEENLIEFNPKSKLANSEHPERKKERKLTKEEAAEKKLEEAPKEFKGEEELPEKLEKEVVEQIDGKKEKPAEEKKPGVEEKKAPETKEIKKEVKTEETKSKEK